MHLIGRYERVRAWHPATDRWDPPLILDRKWAKMTPFACDEWHRLKSGVWIPTLRGGALDFPSHGPQFRLPFHSGGTNTSTAITAALSSVYVFGVSGAAVTNRYIGQGKAVANLYYFISAAATGTQANINDIEAEIRNSNAAVGLPSTTVHSSGAANPNGEATWIGWHKIALSAFTGTYGTYYWAIVTDTDGTAVDNATVQYGMGNADMLMPDFMFGSPQVTTNGFTTVSPSTRWPNILVEYSDGSVIGWSTTAHAAVASSTNRRGLRHSGFTEQMKLLGMFVTNVTANISGIEVYNDDGTVPGGTTQASGTILLRTNTGTLLGALLSTGYTIPKATAQRVVFTFGAASTLIRKLSIGTDNGYTTVMRAARPGGAGYYYALANGTTDWTNDDQDAQPEIALIFEDVVAQASGGAHGGRHPLGMRQIG